MSSPDRIRDGAAVRFPPPLVPLIALAIGIALQLAVWPLPSPLEGLARYASGTLLILAGVVYLTNLILVSSLNATLDEMQIRAGIDPLALAGDLALIEYQKMVFHSVAVLALAGSGILLLLRRGGTS